MKSAVFIIAPTDFRDEELFHTLEELQAKGIKCAIASTHKGECKGRKGKNAHATLEVKEVHAKDFDAVVFVGGGGVIEHKLHENNDVLRIAKEFNVADKVLCAICIAPRILLRANVLSGRKATTYQDQENIEGIKKQGIYTGKPVEIDKTQDAKHGTLITADGPLSAREFGKIIAQELSE